MVNVKTFNAWTARVIPTLLIAIGGYGSYVVIGQIGVAYLIAPQQHGFTQVAPRPGAGIAIIVIFSILIFFVACTYFRVLLTVVTNPGYVPLSQRFHDFESQQRQRSSRPTSTSRDAEKGRAGLQSTSYEQTVSNHRPSPASDQYGLADFYTKDVFVCEGDGRPPWCSTCLDWKPDRSHHCREVQRCVRKMDHFCPWVGGIVSETNFKFFIQFNVYTVLECIFSGIVTAYILAEQSTKGIPLVVHLPIVLGIVSLFGLFCSGMTILSVGYAIHNLTAIEVLSHKVKVWTLAVYLPNPPPANVHPPFQMITFPLVIDPDAEPSQPQRTFAILHSKPGENPFELGLLENWMNVMGYTIWDWLLPLRYSPCCAHDSMRGDYPFGPVLEDMKKRAGIAPAEEMDEKHSHRKRRRRSTRRGTHRKEQPKDSHEVQLQKPASEHAEEPVREAEEDQKDSSSTVHPAQSPDEHDTATVKVSSSDPDAHQPDDVSLQEGVDTNDEKAQKTSIVNNQ